MTSEKDQSSKKIHDDLNQSESDKDFDLDGYIRDKAGDKDSAFSSQYEAGFTEKETSKRTRFVLIAALFVMLLWYFSWSPAEAYYSITNGISNLFASNDPTEQLMGSNEEASGFAFLDYTDAINDLNFDDHPSSPAEVNALYQNGVPLSYMQDLQDLGFLQELDYTGVIALYANSIPSEYMQGLADMNYLDELTYSNVIALYLNGVSVEYLENLSRLNYLDEIDYTGIIGLFANGVSEEYLTGLNRLGFLNELDYSGVIGLSANGVTMSYLQTLNQIGYLDELSYSEVIGLFANGVTEDFLRELHRREMLENMSYSEVIQMYLNN